ncbi:unnamed protein product [Closterium sp. Naga37s-1]|nr:unnamed protein product [Closterium sp. Naga37s-1]
MWVVWVKNRVTHSALPASITPMEAWSGQKPHVGMARIWGCMGSVMLHGHEKGGKLDARAVMCVCVGVDMESKGWRMLDPSLMRIRIARDVDFLENVMWKDWDKANGFGELLQDAAAISQLLPLPLSPPSATATDTAECVGAAAAHPSAAAQWPLGHSAEIRYTCYFLFLLLWSALCPSLYGCPSVTSDYLPTTGYGALRGRQALRRR